MLKLTPVRQRISTSNTGGGSFIAQLFITGVWNFPNKEDRMSAEGGKSPLNSLVGPPSGGWW